MQPFRKNVALAVDGGGLKGIMVTQALSVLETHLGKSCREIFGMVAGTSTGSIISAGIASGFTAPQMTDLYRRLGGEIFKKSLRSLLWILMRYRYPNRPLINALRESLGERTLGELWSGEERFDVVITIRDLVENRTRFAKPWKTEYRDWPLWKAVLASSSVPTYFPVVGGRFVDGGVGSYSNPCYIAAFEAVHCLKWKPEETTLVSLGTGREKGRIKPHQADRFYAWQWLTPLLDSFLSDANDEQVSVVNRFFKRLDFRRFQVETGPVEMDDPSKIGLLIRYGNEMGRMILNDETDSVPIREPVFTGQNP